jgi:hypothetical protein
MSGAHELLERSRAAQGLSSHVEDDATLEVLDRLLNVNGDPAKGRRSNTDHRANDDLPGS